jgi:hypothetical protein
MRSLDVGWRSAVVALAILWTAVPARAQDTLPILFDRHMTIRAGATVTAGVGELVARAEDAVVPARLFVERGVARRATNIGYRFSKLLFFDLPQAQWLTVANHEVMGHGARLRERFDGFIGYSIDAPAPYGAGGGATFFTFDRPPTMAEDMAVSAAGMEADAVAARVVAERAFHGGRLPWRTAIRYLNFELDTFYYVRGTGDDLAAEGAGHDVAQFLRTYNDVAVAAGATPLAPGTARREVLASLANPMFGMAAYAIGRYVWTGADNVTVPAFSIGDVRFLPLVRYQLTPYGTEWAVTSHLSGRRWPSRIEVRIGRAPGVRPCGLAVERRSLTTVQSWRIDLGAEVWRQPDVAARVDPASRPLETGLHIRGRAERPLLPVWFMAQKATAIVDVGVKTAGFVPGEPLGAGFVWRIGIGIPIK